MGRSRLSDSLLAGSLCLALVGVSLSASAQDAQEYARLSAEADSIQRHNSYLEKALAAQQAEIAALDQQLATLDPIAAEFPALIQKMFTELETFVAADVPFLVDERKQRMDRLRDVVGNPETAIPEKYRRLLEAYQIEMDYGRTMEAYEAELAGKGKVHFVRLGRVALMYATPDGKESGYWDAKQKAWVADDDYASGITKAIRIARQELTGDLVFVPAPAPSQGR